MTRAHLIAAAGPMALLWALGMAGLIWATCR